MEFSAEALKSMGQPVRPVFSTGNLITSVFEPLLSIHRTTRRQELGKALSDLIVHQFEFVAASLPRQMAA
jgi:hypothetical protein